MNAKIGMLTVAFALFASPLQAEPKALLIGVGDYKTLDSDLFGIDVDMRTMTDVARSLGFAEDEITVLFDADATYRNIRAALREMGKTVGPKDNALIYFSGHGTRVTDLNNDEPDQVDEALVPHDAYFKPDAPETELRFGNLLIDDEFGELLDAINGDRVIVAIDACHSGTVTRAFSMDNDRVRGQESQVRFLHYPGVPKGSGDILSRQAEDGAQVAYAGLSAAQDDEYALGTVFGGYFTLGIQASIEAALAAGTELSLANMADEVTAFIADRVDEEQLYTPAVYGNREMIDVAIIPTEDGVLQRPRWDSYQALVAEAKPLTVTANQDVYELGDFLQLSIEVPTKGYLNIVSIDSRDQSTVLYPNRFDSDNNVEPGVLAFPTEAMNFDLPASEPTGDTLIVAIFTEYPVNAFDLRISDYNNIGDPIDVFAPVSARATRAFEVVARERRSTFYASQIVVPVIGVAE
ncbi:MAG: caspase family protein [Pseudomonadota bacterium]